MFTYSLEESQAYRTDLQDQAEQERRIASVQNSSPKNWKRFFRALASFLL